MDDGWMMASSRVDAESLADLIFMQFNFLPNSCFLPPAHSSSRHLKWREKRGGVGEGGGRDKEEAAVLLQLLRWFRVHEPRPAAPPAESVASPEPAAVVVLGWNRQQEPSGYQWQQPHRAHAGTQMPENRFQNQRRSLQMRRL